MGGWIVGWINGWSMDEYEQSEDQMNDGGIDGWIDKWKNRRMDNGRRRNKQMNDNGTFLTPYLPVKILNYFEIIPPFALCKETDITVASY